MLTKVSRYDDVTSFFSDHQLTLDVTVEAIDAWKVVGYCTELFSQHNVELLKVCRRTAQTLSFRLDCQDHSDITRMDGAFQASDAPKRIDWTVTVGRKKNIGSSNPCNASKHPNPAATPESH